MVDIGPREGPLFGYIGYFKPIDTVKKHSFQK